MCEWKRMTIALVVCVFLLFSFATVASSSCQVMSNEGNKLFFVVCTDGARLTLKKTDASCQGEGFEKGAWVTVVYGAEEAVMITRFNTTCKLQVVLESGEPKGETNL